MKVIFKNTKLEFQTKPEEVNLTVRTESDTYIGGDNFYGKIKSSPGGAYNSFVANIEGYSSIGISDREIYAFYTSDPVVDETEAMVLGDGHYRVVEVVPDKSYLTPPVGAKYVAISSQESSISITGIL